MEEEPENRRGPHAVGKDEMNLAEFPIALLTDRVPKGLKTIESQDEFFDERTKKVIVRKRIITGSDKYGLPTAKDDEVILGLIQLTRANCFTKRTVNFSRGELIDLLRWPHKGQSYKRLSLSFDRWTSVYMSYEKAWYDNACKSWVDEKFHIIDYVKIYDWEEQRQQPQLKFSSFTWSEPIFRSFQAGYLRTLDLDFYFSLSSATAKRLYRFLDKRFHFKQRWNFDLRDFAFNHLGLTRTGYEGNGQLAKQLRSAIEELEARGFLEPLADGARFERRSRSEWRVLFARGKNGASALPLFEPERPPATPEPKPHPKRKPKAKPEPTPLEQELISRGVTASTACELVAAYPEERISGQVEHFDWLKERHPKKISGNPGGFLASAIRDDYAPVNGFETKTQRAAREEAKREEQRREAEALRLKEESRRRDQEAQAQVNTYLKGLTAQKQEQLDAEALEAAEPQLRASFDQATDDTLKRLYQRVIREAHVRRLLKLPEAG